MDDVINVPVTITVLENEVRDAFAHHGLPMPENWREWARDKVQMLAGFWNDEIESDFVQEIGNDLQMGQVENG